MFSTCVGDPNGLRRNARQLDGLAVEELEPCVAQVLIGDLLENLPGTGSRYAQNAKVLGHVLDVYLVAAFHDLLLHPPGETEVARWDDVEW